MAHYIRDNLPLPIDKVGNKYPVIDAGRQVSMDEVNKILQFCRDSQSYLFNGVFDAAPATIAAATITNATIVTAAIAAATVTHIDAVADQSASVGPEMDWKGFSGRWFIGIDVANAPTSRDFVLAGIRGSYSFPDGVTTSGSPTLTSASGGGFVAAQIGSPISGSGIPVGATIIAVGGLTSLTMSANATITASSVHVTITRNTVEDLVYLKHRGGLSPTLGIGVTPPDGTARLQISTPDTEVAMQTVRLRVGPSQTGKVLVAHDSGATEKWWLDKDYYLSGAHGIGGAVAIQAAASNERALLLTNNAKAIFYGISFPGGNAMRISYVTGGTNILDFESDGGLRHMSTEIGFYGAAAAAKPTVTGSRGGNAALASLLTALAGLGLITDSTTA